MSHIRLSRFIILAAWPCLCLFRPRRRHAAASALASTGLFTPGATTAATDTLTVRMPTAPMAMAPMVTDARWVRCGSRARTPMRRSSSMAH